jgi:molybdenum cofactor biosynthesis enzyme
MEIVKNNQLHAPHTCTMLNKTALQMHALHGSCGALLIWVMMFLRLQK